MSAKKVICAEYIAAVDGPDAAVVLMNAAQRLCDALPESDAPVVEVHLGVIRKRLEALGPGLPVELAEMVKALLADMPVPAEGKVLDVVLEPDVIIGELTDAPVEVTVDGK